MTGIFVPFREHRPTGLGWVELGNGCWEWTGATDHLGYAHVIVDRRLEMAHRAVYVRLRGPIPHGLTLDHLCRNRRCVNPDHMEPVPLADNILRGVGPCARHARKTTCPFGHQYTRIPSENGRGRRRCFTCNKGWQRAYRLRVASRSVRPGG